jgi:hypothetical protein
MQASAVAVLILLYASELTSACKRTFLYCYDLRCVVSLLYKSTHWYIQIAFRLLASDCSSALFIYVIS